MEIHPDCEGNKDRLHVDMKTIQNMRQSTQARIWSAIEKQIFDLYQKDQKFIVAFEYIKHDQEDCHPDFALPPSVKALPLVWAPR